MSRKLLPSDQEMCKAFRNNLKNLLSPYGKKSEVARQAQINPGTITKLLSGELNPTTEHLNRIAQALDISIEQLLQPGATTPFDESSASIRILKDIDFIKIISDHIYAIQSISPSEKTALREIIRDYVFLPRYRHRIIRFLEDTSPMTQTERQSQGNAPGSPFVTEAVQGEGDNSK